MRGKTALGYHCRIDGKPFNTLNELSVHSRKEHPKQKPKIPQLIPLSHDIINTTKKFSRIRQLDKKLRVSLTWCLPHNYEWIRIWKVQETPSGVQIFIEPLQLKKPTIPLSPSNIKKVYK